MTDNMLYFGDNQDILNDYFSAECVDLIYLDPPFNSKATYNVLFKEEDGTRSAVQFRAFSDTWRWDTAAVAAFQGVVAEGGQVAEAMRAFQTLMPKSNMLAYLSMMAPRLKKLHWVLKPTGSLYLHCDPTASHHLKVLLDAVFGPQQFRNEIIWRRTGSHNSSRRFGPIHDVLLFYSKTDGYYFKKSCRPYLKGHVNGYFKKKDAEDRRYWTNALTGKGTRHGESGASWHGYDPTTVGRHWAIPGKIADELGLDPNLSTQEKLDAMDAAGFVTHPSAGSRAMPTYAQYLDRSPGMPLQDLWTYQPHTRGVLHDSEEGIDEDVRWLSAQGDPERLGYETQKPVGLLRRIIESSCPVGGAVLDPFCGCGTTIDAAQRLGRIWFGIDITYLAVGLIQWRLEDVHDLKAKRDYRMEGEPQNETEARALAEYDRYQFQWWAVIKLGGRLDDRKKGADRGIDGRLVFPRRIGSRRHQGRHSVGEVRRRERQGRARPERRGSPRRRGHRRTRHPGAADAAHARGGRRGGRLRIPLAAQAVSKDANPHRVRPVRRQGNRHAAARANQRHLQEGRQTESGETRP